MAKGIGESRCELNVWARRPQSLEALATTPHTVNRTVAERGAASDFVLLVVRDDSDVIDIREKQGLLKSGPALRRVNSAPSQEQRRA